MFMLHMSYHRESLMQQEDMTHRHSLIHFEGQLTLMTSNKQIEKQTASLMFKWQCLNGNV